MGKILVTQLVDYLNFHVIGEGSIPHIIIFLPIFSFPTPQKKVKKKTLISSEYNKLFH